MGQRQQHESYHKIFREVEREQINRWLENIDRRMRDIETMAKELGGDTSQSTLYMGYVELKQSLQKIISIQEGTYTYNLTSGPGYK